MRSLLLALIAAFGIFLGMAELRAAQVTTNAGPRRPLVTSVGRGLGFDVFKTSQVANTTPPGDIARGQALFEGKGECLGCHRVRNKGSRFGPDLTDIGSRAGSIISRGTASPFAPSVPDIGPAGRAHAELMRTLLDPGADILPQNRTVRLVTGTGERITARVLNQDTFSLQVIDTNERVRSIPKGELREFAFIKTSPMPSYRDKFSDQELADVIAYLMSLKGINK